MIKKIFFVRQMLCTLCCVVLMLNLISCASKPTSTVTGTKPYTVRGQKYYPLQTAEGFVEEGVASWYGPGFHGKLTANGETYNQYAMTAAHKLLPLGTTVRVTNLENGKSLVLRINDRGPFVHDRVIDVSKKAAQSLDMHDQGTARVRIEATGSYYDNSKYKTAASAAASALGASSGGSSNSGGASSAKAIEQAKKSRVLNEEGEIPDELKYLFEEEGSGSAGGTRAVSTKEVLEEAKAQVVEEVFSEPAAQVFSSDAMGDFYVQVGEFKVKKFASLAAAKLEDSGYPARSYKEPNQNIWRVRIGPWSTAAKANEFLPKFAGQFPSASIVLAEPKR